MAYQRDCDNPVTDHALVNTRQVCTTTIVEQNSRLRLHTQRVWAFNYIAEHLILLLQEVTLSVKVLDDGAGFTDRG